MHKLTLEGFFANLWLQNFVRSVFALMERKKKTTEKLKGH